MLNARHRRFFRLWPCLLACLAATCFAQVDTGNITGTLTDSTGAVLPGVQLVIVNAATGSEVKVATTERGQYTSPPLRPGNYKVTAQAPGFRRAVMEVTVNLNERAVADMVLQVGGVDEQVTVTAAAPMLQSESSSISSVQDADAIQSLPLNVRNVNQLFSLAAGVVPGDTQSTSVALTAVRGVTQNTVNGLSYRANRFLVDGIDNSENHNGRGVMMYPPVDAIMEFSVQTSTPNAEFGRGGGGAINIYFKTGTNNLHGNLFEFLRNSELDAMNYFATAGSPFKMNQFGGTLGGPIKRNHTFFFFSYDAQRRRQALTYNVSVPIPAFKTGDFSASRNRIYDPLTTAPSGNTYTRAAFPNNAIPQGRLDKAGKALIDLYPEPNGPGQSANYRSSPSQPLNTDAFDVKIDPRLSPRDYTRRLAGAVPRGGVQHHEHAAVEQPQCEHRIQRRGPDYQRRFARHLPARVAPDAVGVEILLLTGCM